jgi:hypothetical protein
VDVRVTRLWEGLLSCHRQAVAVCAAERDAGLADAAGLIGRALERVWEYAGATGAPAGRAVLTQLGRAGEAKGGGGDPPAPERTAGAMTHSPDWYT